MGYTTARPIHGLLLLFVIIIPILSGCGNMPPTTNELPDKWWLHLQGERVYYLQCGGAKLSFVTGEVDYLYDSGYRVINVFVPYHGEKPATDGAPSYCSLAPIDYYNVDPSHGSNEEWAELIETAHTSEQTITVNLAGTGIAVPQTPTDLLNVGGASDITDASYTVTLPPYGFVFYGVTAGQ